MDCQHCGQKAWSLYTAAYCHHILCIIANIVARQHEACIQQLFAIIFYVYSKLLTIDCQHCGQKTWSLYTAAYCLKSLEWIRYKYLTCNMQQTESICLVLQTWYPQTGTRIPIAKRIRHCFNKNNIASYTSHFANCYLPYFSISKTIFPMRKSNQNQ